MPGRPSSRELADFGRRLRSEIERSDRFGSRADFCRKLGIEGATLYRYENGERQPPLDLVQEFADKLGISIERLAGPPTPETRIVYDDDAGTLALEALIKERRIDKATADHARTMSRSIGIATRLEALGVLDLAQSIGARKRVGGPAVVNDARAVIDTASGQRARTRTPKRRP